MRKEYIQVNVQEWIDATICDHCLRPADEWAEDMRDKYGNIEVACVEDHGGNLVGFLCPDCQKKVEEAEANEPQDCEKIAAIRDSRGKLPSYAWPGGYPLYYILKDTNIVCPDCANKLPKGEVELADVNWENCDLYCDECGDRIESAYAEDEDNE